MYSVKNIVRLLSPSPVKLVLAETRYGVRIVGDGWRFVDEDVGVYRRYRVELAIGRPAPHYPVQVFHGERLAEVGFTDDKGYFEYTFDRSGKWKVLAGPRGVAEVLGIEDFFKVFEYDETVEVAGIVESPIRGLGRRSSRVYAITKYRGNRRYEADVDVSGVERWVADRVYSALERRGFTVERKSVEDAAGKLLEPVVAAVVRRFDEHWYYGYGCRRHWGWIMWWSGISRAEVKNVRRTITFAVAGKRVSKTLTCTATIVARYRVRPDWYCREEPWWGTGFVIGCVYIDIELVELAIAPTQATLDVNVKALVADDQPTREFEVAVEGADRCSIGGISKCRAKLKVGPTGVRVV